MQSVCLFYIVVCNIFPKLYVTSVLCQTVRCPLMVLQENILRMLHEAREKCIMTALVLAPLAR